jgi:nucleoid DNA-binding protein
MHHRQVIRQVARRFPDLTQQQVKEVLEVLVEVWRAALAQRDDVVIRDFGTLSVDVQQMRASGVVQAQMGSSALEHLTRLYVRFRPSVRLKAVIERTLEEA